MQYVTLCSVGDFPSAENFGFVGVLHLWQQETAKVAQKKWDLSSMTSQLVVRKKMSFIWKLGVKSLACLSQSQVTDSELQQLGKEMALHFVVHNTLSHWICCVDVWDRVNIWELSLWRMQIDTFKIVEINTVSYRIRLNKLGKKIHNFWSSQVLFVSIN